MNELMKKLQKASTIAESALLNKSMIYDLKDSSPTPVPMVNVALSGNLDGGLTAGLTMLAGPSKHFKSAFALLMAAAYLKKHKDGVLIFYDSEFGTPRPYFESFGIDPARVLWTPVTDVEKLKQDILPQLENIQRGEHVCIIVDSLGNLASIKELDDTMSGKTVADMTRAKSLKSLFRMLVPRLNLKDIPLLCVNHTYLEMCLEGSTLIRTEKGNIPIKDIEVGDMVYALNGLKKVLATYGPNQLNSSDKKFLEIEFDDGSIIKCTHDHKFLNEDKNWTEAIDLKIGQNMF